MSSSITNKTLPTSNLGPLWLALADLVALLTLLPGMAQAKGVT